MGKEGKEQEEARSRVAKELGTGEPFIGPLFPTGPSDDPTGVVIRASFAKNRSHSHQFNLKAKRRQEYKSFVISRSTKGPTFYKERLAPT